MYPLALLALLIYTNGIELVIFLSKGNIQLGRDTEWLQWVYSPESAKGRAGEIIRYTQENVSASKHVRNRFEEVRQSILHNVERRVIFLNTLVAAAPLMGLLGTVIGMLATFSGIARLCGIARLILSWSASRYPRQWSSPGGFGYPQSRQPHESLSI